jgi:hypothetical protein
MPSENYVLETKKKRFRVLNTIYDFAGQLEQNLKALKTFFRREIVVHPPCHGRNCRIRR